MIIERCALETVSFVSSHGKVVANANPIDRHQSSERIPRHHQSFTHFTSSFFAISLQESQEHIYIWSQENASFSTSLGTSDSTTGCLYGTFLVAAFSLFVDYTPISFLSTLNALCVTGRSRSAQSHCTQYESRRAQYFIVDSLIDHLRLTRLSNEREHIHIIYSQNCEFQCF